MKVTRKHVVRVAAGVAVIALTGWLLHRPGTSFADRVDKLQPGMTWAEVEEVMGSPPGDYQTPWGNQHFHQRSITIRPGGSAINSYPTFRTWNGDDGEVCVWGVSNSEHVTKVDWAWNGDRRHARSNAEILREEVSGLADGCGRWWADLHAAMR